MQLATLLDINLAPYVTNPLTEEELGTLEELLDRSIPSVVREILTTIGFPQNVCYRLPEDEFELTRMQTDVHPDFFGFAHDEDEDLLLCDSAGNVFKHASRLDNYKVIGHSVAQFVKANIVEAETNVELAWHTQLSFHTNREDAVIAALGETFHLTSESGWQYSDTSPADVVTDVRHFESTAGEKRLSRLSYHGWDEPIFFINFRFRPDEIKTAKARIKQLTEADVGFKLVNYGILPFNLDSENE